MIKNWRKCAVCPDSTIVETIKVIDANSGRTIVVVDANDCLLGTVTDGDIRRGLLSGYRLEDTITEVMNISPRTGNINEDPDSILLRMQETDTRQFPIIDGKGRVVRLEEVHRVVESQTPRSNTVVLMAGGMGTRLQPLTTDTPKPLLKIGEKPLLETILENFIKHGFQRFYISVNFKAEMVISHFGDGSRWGCEINYLQEQKQMGTAGSLSLLNKEIAEPILVMNGDLLTNINVGHLLDYHFDHKAIATVCVRDYDFEVPFGVVNMDEQYISSIDEKPISRFFVNAGIYVLDPECLDYVPRNEHYDMTNLLNRVLRSHKKIVAFPIREYWLDIGRPDDFTRANIEFGREFN